MIHIEAATDVPYTLGQLVMEWNVRLTRTCLGALCDDSRHALQLYVDGRLQERDPGSLVLRPHQEVVLWYAARDVTPRVPSGTDFPRDE